MSLSPGEKVGPYEILAALGVGGMGEVYRACDGRLERDVAIKVLSQSFAGDPDRQRRFQQEARALATLNHPNIVAVHEIGEYRDSYYMVSELLEGETLRETLIDGPLSQRRAIEYASQIAEGLAAAHDKGVVHRDLKPENVFVTKDGRLKILDFGLAKLARTEAFIPGEGATATALAQTMPGMVLGTAGYMAPEQVRGKEVDGRTDIFAFGAILYEILSGRRAFKGESSIETMNAILKDDPPELEVEKLKLSPGLERIVRRCLEKEPSRRFQSARDVGFALEAISGTSSTSPVKQQALPPERPRWLHAAALALLFVAGIAAAYFAGRRSIPASSPSYHQLTFESGYAGPARFTRDGNTVVYSAAWNGGARRLYTQRSNSIQSNPLDVDADVLGITDNGDMALILKRRFLATWLQHGTLARMSIDGGAPRPILDDVYDADITRDGKAFAVVRRDGGKQRLEFPIGKVLFEASGWISDVRISPDGSEIAFMDHPVVPDDRGGIAVVDRQGSVKRLTQYYSTGRSLCWSPDGKEIWFTASIEDYDFGLYAVTVAGKIRTVARMPVEMVLQDISASGRVLLETARYQIEMGVKRSGESRAHDLANFVDLGGISPDGQWLVYNDFTSGDYVALARKGDGAAPIRVGQGYGDGITWDGSLVAASRNTEPNKLYLYPTGVGEQRVIDLGDLRAGSGTFQNDITFSRDGRWGLLSAFNSKGEVREYLFDLRSGKLRAVTPVGMQGGKLSPDAAQVVALEIARQKPVLVDVASGKVSDVSGVEDGEEMLAWNADGRGIVVWNQELPAKITNVNLTTGKRQLVQSVEPLSMLGSMYVQMVASADGKTAVYRHRRGLYAIHIADDLR
jgi:serine/threonine protein kinase/Tol biopolymer transport system component